MIWNPKSKCSERGTALVLGTASLVFLVPMIGIAVDVGFLYSAKARLQAAVDGSSLAAARSLNLGQTLAAQKATATQNAVNWFYGNFPPGTWGTTNTQMDNTISHVNIYPDMTNPQLDHVDVTATTKVPTYFMKWFGSNATTITAIGNATRRAAVVMMVLDRSGSMCTGGSQPCGKAQTTLPCAQMLTAAKQFTGQFAEGRDYIGLVSFSTNTYVHSPPTTSFQTTLGFSNNSGSGNGQIDNISCAGGTNTAEGVSMAYQLLKQTGLPGALNIIMLETDGLPNSLSMNFYDSVNSVAGLNNASTCTDTVGKKISQAGGFSSNHIPSWTTGLNLQASPFLTTTGYYSNIPAGMVGVVYSSDPGGSNNFTLMFNDWSNTAQAQSTGTAGNPYNTNNYLSAAGCAFNGGQTTTNPSDIKWFPKTDVFGNSLKPGYSYQLVTTDAQGHITQSGSNPANWTNYHNAALNATENSAYVARANTTMPAYVFAIGLGGNGNPPDPVLLQRMANDPNGDQFNATPAYVSCAMAVNCVTVAGQYQGKFVYAPNTAQLNQAFQVIASQILRLSK